MHTRYIPLLLYTLYNRTLNIKKANSYIIYQIMYLYILRFIYCVNFLIEFRSTYVICHIPRGVFKLSLMTGIRYILMLNNKVYTYYKLTGATQHKWRMLFIGR